MSVQLRVAPSIFVDHPDMGVLSYFYFIVGENGPRSRGVQDWFRHNSPGRSVIFSDPEQRAGANVPGTRDRYLHKGTEKETNP